MYWSDDKVELWTKLKLWDVILTSDDFYIHIRKV